MNNIITDVILNISPIHIELDPENLQRDDGIALISDIKSSVLVEPGHFAFVPTPFYLTGDSRTIALIQVFAGQSAEFGDHAHGDFIVPKPDDVIQVHAKVLNQTSATLLIAPGQELGLLSFHAIAVDDDMFMPATPSYPAVPADPVEVAAVFQPEFIERSLAPAYATEGASGMDLRADIAEPITIPAGEQRVISTGLRLAIPDGYEAQIRARSGLAAKYGIGLTNGLGSIDQDYRGILGCIISNQGADNFTINPADRIAQLVFAPVTKVKMDYVDSLDLTDRGEGGFGSTGRS